MADIETATRAYLRAKLEEDFLVYEDWQGRHMHGGEYVKYDLVLQPRPHLVERGFDNGFFVIEVKLFNTTDKMKHDTKAKDLLWQCISYSFSEIVLSAGALEKPLFVLYYIGGNGFDQVYEDDLNFLHHFVQRGGVGRLDIHPKYGWIIKFGGTNYFRKTTGKGPHHVGTKRQVGSSR